MLLFMMGILLLMSINSRFTCQKAPGKERLRPWAAWLAPLERWPALIILIVSAIISNGNCGDGDDCEVQDKGRQAVS